MANLVERYVASMVLGGVGDAMGYHGGSWEFCKSGEKIHEELEQLGGIKKLHLNVPEWIVSDDTVLHLATGEALVEHGQNTDKESLYLKTARYYIKAMNDMNGRAPGACTLDSCYTLKPECPKGYQIPFNPSGGGCGAAMRSMCIGLRYPSEKDIDYLVSYSIEAGRMTHNHPTGYLGSLASALFISYAIQGKPPREWGAGLLGILPKALQYVESQARDVQKNKDAWSFFEHKWQDYLKVRGLMDGTSDACFPEKYDVRERDEFYSFISYSGWGGSSGHDAPMIAYDALLGCGGSWVELCKRGMLHGGDNDSTGTIAGAMFGALFGFKGVPQCNYKHLEYCDRLVNVALALYKLSHPGATVEEIKLHELGIDQK